MHFRRTRRLAVACAIVAVAAATAATSASAGATHMFWGQGTGLAPDPNALSNDLIYHGGSAGDGAIGIQKAPAVYLVYWGAEWASGFTTADTDGKLYSSKTLQNYVNSFVAGLGGSAYAGIQTQYCRGIPAGSTSCAGDRGRRLHHEPEASAEGRLDGSDAGAGRHHRLGPGAERRRRPDRDGGHARVGALRLRPRRDLLRSSRRRARSRPASRPTAGTTPRRPASTASATRTGSSTRSSPGRTWTGRDTARRAACTT